MKSRDTLFVEAKSADVQQRKLARLSLFMTAADLCDNLKKWDDNLPTVVCLFIGKKLSVLQKKIVIYGKFSI